MPRIARRIAPGVVYHLIARFVDHEWLIRHRRERERYLELFAGSLASSDWRCLAYALMSNHIHLALLAGRQPLWRWLKRVHSPWARWLNDRRERIGSVFADRPKAYAIPPGHVATLLAYIHNNPVRAKVVPAASESGWTSHRAYAGSASPPPWLHVADGLRLSSIASASKFNRFVVESAREQRDLSVLDALKSVLKPQGRIEYATPVIGDRIAAPLLQRPYAPLRPDPLRIIELVAASVGADVSKVRSRVRSAGAIESRRIVVHVGKALGHTGSDIAASLGISPAAVTKLSAQTLSGGAQRIAVRVADFVSTEAASVSS